MTDIVQAREASIAAETRVERLFSRVLDRLHALNSRLVVLHDDIKSAQPVASGAICLELYACGPGCAGCPHPRWVRYHWRPGVAGKPNILICTNLNAQQRDPVLALERKTSHYKTTVALIREAKAILADRTALLSALKTLRNGAKLK